MLLLDDVVKPLQDELETMLAERQQRLLLTDVESEAVVSGDATLIRVILRNLVENAHRYSPQGSRIRVSVKAGLMPVMAVEDEGPGIDEAKSGELSKAFVRMDSRYGGIGLGPVSYTHLLLRRLTQPVAGSVVRFAATTGNGKNSNTGRDKLSASLAHLNAPFEND